MSKKFEQGGEVKRYTLDDVKEFFCDKESELAVWLGKESIGKDVEEIVRTHKKEYAREAPEDAKLRDAIDEKELTVVSDARAKMEGGDYTPASAYLEREIASYLAALSGAERAAQGGSAEAAEAVKSIRNELARLQGLRDALGGERTM